MEEENRQPEDITEEALAGKKKKKLDLWIDIIIIVVLLLAVVYAVNRDRHKHRDVVQKEMLRYLEKRYGEEFELVENSYRTPDYAHSFVSAEARPKACADEQHTFQIQGYFNRWGGLEYFDGYVMVQLQAEYEQRIDEIIDATFDDYKFFLEFHSEWLTNNLPVGTTVDDLKNYSANVDYPLPDLGVFMRPSQLENFNQDNVEEVCEKMAEIGYRGTITITCYEYDSHYERKTRENQRKAEGSEADHWKYFVVFIYSEDNIDYRQGE